MYKDYGPLLTHTQVYANQTFQQNQDLPHKSILMNHRTITEQSVGVHFRKAFVTWTDLLHLRLHWGAEKKLRKSFGISDLGLNSLCTRLGAEIPAIRGRVSTEGKEQISKDELRA